MNIGEKVADHWVEAARRGEEHYAQALAGQVRGNQATLRAVIEVGSALHGLRKIHKSHKAFAEAVAAAGLDKADPWSQRQERTAAMQIATLSSERSLAFDGCPATRPTHVMSWWRKENPSPERAAKTKAKQAKTKARKTAEANATEEQQLELAEEQMSPKSKVTVEKAIAIHKKRLERSFETVVNETVKRRIDAANDAVRQQLAELRKREMQLTSAMQAKGVFSKREFRELLMCCHPDSSASVEVKNRLTAILVQNELRLVKPEGAAR